MPRPQLPRQSPPRRTALRRTAVVIATLIIVAAILAVTLLKAHVAMGGLWDAAVHQRRDLDLMLFDGWRDPYVWYAPWTNTLGNIALFVPFGVVVALGRDAFNRHIHPVLLGAVAGFGLSLGIEVAQFVFALGYSDVDDLLNNTIGATLGAFLARFLGRADRFATVATLGIGAVVIVTVMFSGLVSGA